MEVFVSGATAGSYSTSYSKHTVYCCLVPLTLKHLCCTPAACKLCSLFLSSSVSLLFVFSVVRFVFRGISLPGLFSREFDTF